MDLIYTTPELEDIGVLHTYELDLAFGEDENSFECVIPSKDHCCSAGSFLYVDDTEYGGIVDSIKSNTERQEVTYSGRTWHGILASKVVLPLQADGEPYVQGVLVNESLANQYLRISGDANLCLAYLIERTGLEGLFAVSSSLSGIEISAYQFQRYTDLYTGIRKMLQSAGAKLRIRYKDGKAVLSAVPLVDYSDAEEFDSDQYSYTASRHFNTVNHLICLGSGELADRMVIHLYADADGNISQTKTFTGLDDITATYDYPNVESEDELVSKGREELRSLWEQNEINISLDESEAVYDIGDTVGAYDNITGLSSSAAIVKTIVAIKDGKINISYKVGDKK